MYRIKAEEGIYMQIVHEIPSTLDAVGAIKILKVCSKLITVEDVETLFDYEANNKSLQTFTSLEDLAKNFEEELIDLADIEKSDFYYEMDRKTFVFHYHKILRTGYRRGQNESCQKTN